MRRRELLSGLAGWPLLAALPATAAPARQLMAQSAQRLVAGRSALDVWAYDGQVPGPVLRFRRGAQLNLELVNGLTDPTTIHWHGIRVPNAMDGVPHLTQAPVAPGERFSYRFPLPDAGTHWYHPHWGTPEQVERGLAGALVVEDDVPTPVDDDVVWVLDDWRLTPDGRISEDFYRFHDVAHAGRIGSVVTVNGQVAPVSRLRAGQRVRLRLINAANARIFAVALQGLSGWLITRDGMQLDQAQPWEGGLLLGPGMRADLIVDAVESGRFAIVDDAGREPRPLAWFEVDGATARTRAWEPPVPPRQAPLPSPVLAEAVTHEVLLGGGARNREGWPQESAAQRQAREQRRAAGSPEAAPAWTLNGRAHTHHDHHAEPDLRVERGRTVRWVFRNRTAWWHPMHLHGHHMRLVSRNGQPLPADAWRDTALLAPGDEVEAAFVADNPGRWLLHCHVLEHHAGGMGMRFDVV